MSIFLEKKGKKIEELLSKLMQICGIGTIILPVKPVSGGFLHRMYQVLGECMDDTEKMMGISEVENTINRIKYIHSNEQLIKVTLDSRLPKII